MTRKQSAMRVGLLFFVVTAIIVLIPVGVVSYLTYRAEQALRKNADQLEHSLQIAVEEWEFGRKAAFQSAWYAAWSNAVQLSQKLVERGSLTTKTERRLVEVLSSREAKLYFSTPNVREEFAVSPNIVMMRNIVADPEAPPSVKRIWAVVEERLAEPPTPWPAPGSKRQVEASPPQ